MRIKFTLNSRPRKDGRQNVRIRITNGRNDKEFRIQTSINILKEFWDDKEARVSKQHPNFDVINRALKKYKDRKEHCIDKFDSEEWTLVQVKNYMDGQSDFNFVDDYVMEIFRKRKTNVTFTDYLQKLNILKSHMGIKGKLRFKDINRDWFYRLLDKLKKKGLTKSSIRSYSIAIGSILKDAEEEGVIQAVPKRPKEFRQGGKQDRNRKPKQIESCTSEQVEQAILGVKTIEQLQSVGFWLLAFCLRGFYPADIVKLEEAEIDKPTLVKLFNNELFIEHLRSKSEHTENEHMYIHIDFKTTYRLIRRLKFITAYTHHYRQSYVADIDDELKIFDYNPTDNYTWHLNRWALHTRRIRKYGMSMKNARKSFLTFAKGLGVDEDTRLILVGRKNDPILARSYDNNADPTIRNKVTEAHRLILKRFNVEKLVNMYMLKLQSFNVPIWVKKEANRDTKFKYDKKYKWYFKGSQRFGVSKHTHVPKFKELVELQKKLKELKKDEEKVVKMYPQLKLA